MKGKGKALYAPRFVDFWFAVSGIGAAILLGMGLTDPAATSLAAAAPVFGPIALGMVLLAGLASCLFHRIDRRGWDDYMAQVVSQSALFGLVTFLIAAGLTEVIAINFYSGAASMPLITGAIPMAMLGWAIGYAFVRFRGVSE